MSAISHIFQFSRYICRFHTVDSESEVRIHYNDRFDCQILHFTPLSDEFLVQIQTTNAKRLLLRKSLNFINTLFRDMYAKFDYEDESKTEIIP